MEPIASAGSATRDLEFETLGVIALIVLRRTEVLNALTHAMCIAIDRQLAAWARDPSIAAVIIRSASDRAFCAGGDVRALYDCGVALKQGEAAGKEAQDFIRDEYRMNRRIKTYSKPFIALIDGLTMGGGFGVSVHGSHRVATERTLFAMPETAIGLFPDVGASYVLPRLPYQAGAYLGLTGKRIKAADMIALGLATHFVSSAEINGLLDDLVGADWHGDAHDVAGRVIGHREVSPGEGDISRHFSAIEHCFRYDEVTDILQALDGMGSAMATEAATRIRAMSPTSVKLTLAANRRGRHLVFDDCMVMEYQLIQSILMRHDFYEGVRALLIDKDRKPRWEPATLETVDDAMLESYFVAPPPGDLIFID
jgi:enoyl-CoA hydratase/carnithine racemase